MVQVLRANSSATSLVRLRLRPRPRLRLGVGVGVGLPAGRWLPGVRLPGACTLTLTLTGCRREVAGSTS
jgi:hypothetical protein